MAPNLLRLLPGRSPARVGGALLVLAIVGSSACGEDGDGNSDGAEAASSMDGGSEAVGTEHTPRTVEVDMVDNAFEPAEVEVAAGETVRFVFRNTGAVVHDAVIGDEAAQAEHELDMRAAEHTATSGNGGEMDEMGHGTSDEGGDDEAAITVEPGERGEITHTFASAGDLLIGCHEPGHYDAGMKIGVSIA